MRLLGEQFQLGEADGDQAAEQSVPARNVSPAANDRDGAGQTKKSPMTSS